MTAGGESTTHDTRRWQNVIESMLHTDNHCTAAVELGVAIAKPGVCSVQNHNEQRVIY